MNFTESKSKPFQLMIFKSNQHIYAQIMDPNTIDGHILVSASTIEKSYRLNFAHLDQTENAKKIGSLVAKRALELGINRVVLNLKKKKSIKNNRKAYRFQGKVKALVLEMVNSGLSIKKN